MARHAFSSLFRAATVSLALIASLTTQAHSSPSPVVEVQNIARDSSDPVFSAFNIYEETYKKVNSSQITAAILVPKGLKPGKHPVILNIHAGWLITADALYGPFFQPWVLEVATAKSAIIVSANHRLLPSANGLPDPLKDAEDFWQWTKTQLPTVLARRCPGLKIDFSKLLLNGASSGGYLAAQLGLTYPKEISVLTLAYPWLDLKDNLYTTGPRPGQPNIIHYPDDQIPPKDVVVSWIEETRKTTTSKAGPERVPYIVGASYYGIFYDLILDNKKYNNPSFLPLDRIKAGGKLPAKVWLMHGDQDVTVPINGSNDFAALVAQWLPKTSLRYDIARGQDHLFDTDVNNWSTFKQQALDFVLKGWLN